MDEFLKALWVVFLSAIMAMISYFEPVINMILAITIIFVTDIVFGIASGKKINKEKIDIKKGFAAIKLLKEEKKLKNKTTIKANNDGYNLNEKRKYTLKEYLKTLK